MTTITLQPTHERTARRPRPRAPESPAWSCENCAQTNTGRRRRCEDCGTSHF